MTSKARFGWGGTNVRCRIATHEAGISRQLVENSSGKLFRMEFNSTGEWGEIFFSRSTHFAFIPSGHTRALFQEELQKIIVGTRRNGAHRHSSRTRRNCNHSFVASKMIVNVRRYSVLFPYRGYRLQGRTTCVCAVQYCTVLSPPGFNRTSFRR